MDSTTRDASTGSQPRAPGCLLFALALAVVPPVGAGTTSAQAHPPQPAPVRQAGLPNYGVVSAQLHRGGQPDDSGFAHLKRLGIAIVVNLRHEADRIARERTLVERQGMQYVSIPWRGYDTPTTAEVAQFLRVLRDHPQQKVFVHCERGAERTGVMIACYRIGREQWTAERALAEMNAFGFRRRFTHLTKFVRDFPALLLRDPVLRSSAGPDAREGSDRPRRNGDGAAGLASVSTTFPSVLPGAGGAAQIHATCAFSFTDRGVAALVRVPVHHTGRAEQLIRVLA